MTSTLPVSITEMARFEGVPPNMSVRMITPAPSSTSADRLEDVVAAPLDVVVGADRDGLDLGLRADDMLERGAELHGKPAVGHEDKSDHRPGFRLNPAV